MIEKDAVNEVLNNLKVEPATDSSFRPSLKEVRLWPDPKGASCSAVLVASCKTKE